MNPRTSILAPALIVGAAIVGAVAIGATLALTGVISRPEVIDPLSTSSIDARTANAYDCVGGAVVSTLDAGQRVLVVSRSADGEWVGVRNPGATAQTVWLPVPVLTLDEGDALADDMPVGGECATSTITLDAETVVPDETEAPSGPGAGTTAPTLGALSVSPTPVGCDHGFANTIAQLSVTASNATAVSLTWSGSYTGSAAMQGSGSTWSFTFDAAGPGYNYRGDTVFTAIATDAAGNQSAASSATLFIDCVV